MDEQAESAALGNRFAGVAGKFKPFLSSFFKSRRNILYLAVFLIVSAIGANFYLKYSSAVRSSQDILGQNTARETADLVSKVGNLIELPSETPTIATVSDVTKLTNEAFFEGAQNGDKVLIFPKAKKAFLYRPSTNKLINVGPVNIPTQPVVNPSQTPLPSGAKVQPSSSISPSAAPSPTLIPTATPTRAQVITPTPTPLQ